MPKCSWCGGYIAEKDGMLKEAANQMGLGIFTKIGGAVIPHYCSKECKLKAQASKTGAAVGGEGGGGTTIIQKKGMFDTSESDAEVQARKESEQAERAEKESIQSMRFDGTGDDIAENLNKLFAKYSAIPTGLAAPADAKSQKAAIIEKMEFGIMKLRKADPDTAEFFQKKLDGLTAKKPGLFGKK